LLDGHVRKGRDVLRSRRAGTPEEREGRGLEDRIPTRQEGYLDVSGSLSQTLGKNGTTIMSPMFSYEHWIENIQGSGQRVNGGAELSGALIEASTDSKACTGEWKRNAYLSSLGRLRDAIVDRARLGPRGTKGPMSLDRPKEEIARMRESRYKKLNQDHHRLYGGHTTRVQGGGKKSEKMVIGAYRCHQNLSKVLGPAIFTGKRQGNTCKGRGGSVKGAPATMSDELVEGAAEARRRTQRERTIREIKRREENPKERL